MVGAEGVFGRKRKGSPLVTRSPPPLPPRPTPAPTNHARHDVPNENAPSGVRHAPPNVSAPTMASPSPRPTPTTLKSPSDSREFDRWLARLMKRCSSLESPPRRTCIPRYGESGQGPSHGDNVS